MIETGPTFISPLGPIYEEANFALEEGQKFLSHTNRLSNVEPVTFDNANSPHFTVCSGLSKVLTFMCYQVDGTETAEPSVGFFTSLFINQELTDYRNTVITYPDLIKNSIVTTTVPTGEDEYTTTSSNLTVIS